MSRRFLLRWAREGEASPHSRTPSRADLERHGWVRIGGDPRYPGMVLMRRHEHDDVVWAWVTAGVVVAVVLSGIGWLAYAAWW